MTTNPETETTGLTRRGFIVGATGLAAVVGLLPRETEATDSARGEFLPRHTAERIILTLKAGGATAQDYVNAMNIGMEEGAKIIAPDAMNFKILISKELENSPGENGLMNGSHGESAKFVCSGTRTQDLVDYKLDMWLQKDGDGETQLRLVNGAAPLYSHPPSFRVTQLAVIKYALDLPSVQAKLLPAPTEPSTSSNQNTVPPKSSPTSGATPTNSP